MLPRFLSVLFPSSVFVNFDVTFLPPNESLIGALVDIFLFPGLHLCQLLPVVLCAKLVFYSVSGSPFHRPTSQLYTKSKLACHLNTAVIREADLFDRIQRNAVWPTNDPSLTSNVQSCLSSSFTIPILTLLSGSHASAVIQ